MRELHSPPATTQNQCTPVFLCVIACSLSDRSFFWLSCSPAAYEALLKSVNILVDNISPSVWVPLHISKAFVRRIPSTCSSLCNSKSYSGESLFSDGSWVTNVDTLNELFESIGDPSTEFTEQGTSSPFQVTVIVPGLSVSETGLPAAPKYYSWDPSTSSSGPNLAMIIPLAVIGGVALLLLTIMAIYRRCKMRAHDPSYSRVETDAVSTIHADDGVQMDTYPSSPSPMLATAPTATVVPSNYAPAYMVSNGSQYYMVSNQGMSPAMSPMYTQPVQGGYILTYMPTQTNQ